MSAGSFRKGVAIYFLALALPGIGLALYGEWSFWTFLQMPDSPGDPDGVNKPRIATEIVGLGALLVLGVALLPGYLCQVFKPAAVRSWFWPLSALYNFILLPVYASYFGWPDRHGPILAIFGVALGVPLLGLCLSLACAAKGQRS